MTPYQAECLGFIKTYRAPWMLPSYIMAHIEVECSWNPRASTDGFGSLGPMQVLPATARGVGEDGDQADTKTSIRTGIKVLVQMDEALAQHFGRPPYLYELVEAYNEGAGNVDAGRLDPEYWDKWARAQTRWAYVDAGEVPPAVAPQPPDRVITVPMHVNLTTGAIRGSLPK